MIYSNRLLAFLFAILFVTTNFVYAETWVDTNNTVGPKVYLDTDSIYKYQDGYVYTIKHTKNGRALYTQIELKPMQNKTNLAAILSVDENYKNIYEIPSEREYKRITSDKGIYNSTQMVLAKSYSASCSPFVCTAITKKENKPESSETSNNETKQNVDWGPYMKDVERRIKKNWTPPKGNSSKHAVVTFTVGRDGRVLSNKVTKSSGNPLVDKAAIDAIYLAAPFKPLPTEFKGQSVPIEFTFDYNVINGNQNGIYNKNF